MIVLPTDFRFARVPNGFKWFGVDIGGLPLVYWPSGAICEPLIRYFAHGWRTRLFTSVRSMAPEVYALREFLALLENRLIHWLDADDDDLSIYRDIQNELRGRGLIGKAQIDKKVAYVFKFYTHIQTAMPFQSNQRLTPKFVGEPEQNITPFSSKEVLTRRRGRILVWSRSEASAKSVKKRPTPSPDSVKRILDHLRYTSKEDKAKRTSGWKSQQRRLEGERNWLIARCEAEAGLRREETSSFTVRHLAIALSEERLLGINSVRNPDAATARLLLAARDEDVRDNILGRLERFRERGHETLFITMKRKRGVASVQFPIDLIEDLLRIGVWSIHRAYTTHWSSLDQDYRVPEELFLSGRDGKGLSPGSVGDIVNDAFAELDIAGSGHRLRAYYLTNMAWLIWNENFALNGYQFDAAIVNMTLDRIAELAGHSDPSVTAQHYLDMALIRHFSRTNRERLSAMSDLLNSIIRAGPTLSDEVAGLLEEVVYKLADASQPHFRIMLKSLVDDDFSDIPPDGAPPNRWPSYLQPVT